MIVQVSSTSYEFQECIDRVWFAHQVVPAAAAAAALHQSCPTLCDPIDDSPPGSPTAAAAAAKSIQSCPTLCDPVDGSPLGSPIPGILKARTLEWVAISFSNA